MERSVEEVQGTLEPQVIAFGFTPIDHGEGAVPGDILIAAIQTLKSSLSEKFGGCPISFRLYYGDLIKEQDLSTMRGCQLNSRL